MAAGIEGDRSDAVPRRGRQDEKLGPGAMSRTRCLVTWCAAVLPVRELRTAIGCHTFRATGITDDLTNGGRIEVAQRMDGHSNAKTTGLYDRRSDDISVANGI